MINTEFKSLKEAYAATKKNKDLVSIKEVTSKVHSIGELLNNEAKLISLAEDIAELEELVQIAEKLTPKLKEFIVQTGRDLNESATIARDGVLFENTLNRYAAISGFFSNPLLSKLMEAGLGDSKVPMEQEFGPEQSNAGIMLTKIFMSTQAARIMENAETFIPVAKELAKLSGKQLSAFITSVPRIEPMISERTARTVAGSLQENINEAFDEQKLREINSAIDRLSSALEPFKDQIPGIWNAVVAADQEATGFLNKGKIRQFFSRDPMKKITAFYSAISQFKRTWPEIVKRTKIQGMKDTETLATRPEIVALLTSAISQTGNGGFISPDKIAAELSNIPIQTVTSISSGIPTAPLPVDTAPTPAAGAQPPAAGAQPPSGPSARAQLVLRKLETLATTAEFKVSDKQRKILKTLLDQLKSELETP